MNKKRIAQYCCAALVAAGIGLNIQNAIADYGIGENSLSLVAVGGSGSGSNSNSNSNETTESSNPHCLSGGPGSTSCQHHAGGTVLGNGGEVECSVSCADGYYACCRETCFCVPNKK